MPRSLGRETKYQRVYAELELIVNRLEPEAKLPSIRQLSATLETSVNTLAGVLDDLEGQGLIYRRPGAGVFVSPQKTKTIWLICRPDFFSDGHAPFWDVLRKFSYLQASQKNLRLEFHLSVPHGESESPLYELLAGALRAGRVQGVIGLGLSLPTTRWILAHDIPYVAFAGWAPFSVGQDYPRGIELGVEALAASGCHHIGLWLLRELESCHPDDTSEHIYSITFRKALERHGLNFDPKLVEENFYATTSHDNLTFGQHGFRSASNVFGKPGVQPDGVVITDDRMTQGALLALARLGVKVNQDIVLASFANAGVPVSSGDDEMILIEFNPANLVNRLFEMLEDLMNARTPRDLIQRDAQSQVAFVGPKLVLPKFFRNSQSS